MSQIRIPIWWVFNSRIKKNRNTWNLEQNRNTASNVGPEIGTKNRNSQPRGFLVACWVKMLSVHLGWDWAPPQTTSFVHIRNIKSVWTNWYAVHGHTVAALHSHNHTSWLSVLGSGSLVEPKWCHNIMGQADSQLKLLPSSILDI